MNDILTAIISITQLVLTTVIISLLVSNSKNSKGNKDIIANENRKEMDILNRMKKIKLTEPLTEKSRPENFSEIIGQEQGIKALRAALCGPNPQHVLIYGPPGVGKTAAARLVLEEAKKNNMSPFKYDAKFVEIDATTLRYDDRGIADPLIGSVHDPIYQGAGAMGIAGIPQPKPGAVTKAHGGVLFIDEIGELQPIQINKLLKVLEDRKVILDSAYYCSEDPNMPTYIKEVFENGYPADFRLIGATTRSPEEIAPAIRSRCVEIFFRALDEDEIKIIAKNAVKKSGYRIDEKSLDIISKFCSNGREVINLVQLGTGIAVNSHRDIITDADINWIIENGQYSMRPEKKINDKPLVGVVNALAVYGANMGTVMEIEATAKKTLEDNGSLKVTGIVEEEEISSYNRKVKRKSTAYCSVENVLTVLDNIFNLGCKNYDIHINFPGGIPIDGPSAGISIATAVYSAITKKKVNNKVAMTGEISLQGKVKPIGGVSAKISAAVKAGASIVIIPEENWSDEFKNIKGIEIKTVRNISDVLGLALLDMYDKMNNVNMDGIDILSAKSMN
ncbi:MAG: ATP-dependent protease LonB [Inconstantimicrobium porci]|uniref:endopeptidase La n=1 Tax=Inconstantimicrobium porci TaxID=2652291 RepID=A0A7X2MVQ7_9CLOT|nr:ATP-dependent protease LonB [Inconstantimicrobium porci]MDD6770978.1 ATP-dependent protease LonB [Inconstantimicrobium porci]MDY5912998.1 ATP-dependent protease LonB [Inconstantimicrobium porci]MSR89934.1 ATP-dependent protease LonB [Inconstantimicrobium porci]